MPSLTFGKLLSVSGLGFGLISGSFSFVNVLADSAGPGTVGLRGDSTLFFFTSAVTTLCFILLHTFWGVIFFHSLDKRQYSGLAWVLLSHLLVSCLVSWSLIINLIYHSSIQMCSNSFVPFKLPSSSIKSWILYFYFNGGFFSLPLFDIYTICRKKINVNVKIDPLR